MSITQYRAAIGRWHLFTICRPRKTKTHHKHKLGESLLAFITNTRPLLLLLLMLSFTLLLKCGDVEKNPGPVKSLVVNHINAHSLCPSDRSKRLDEIHSTLCVTETVDIICISETWLQPNISDNDVSLQDYQLFRRDRKLKPGDGIGGGVAIYAHDSIPVKRRIDLENNSLEMVVCEAAHQNRKFIIATCYRPPGMTALQITNFLFDLQTFIT